MVTMIGRPPERALLGGGLSQESHEKLKSARSFESPVREVTMIKPCDREHAQVIHPHAKSHPFPRKGRGDRESERQHMNRDERNRTGRVNLFNLLSAHIFSLI